jgi:drug/metabolite transporter (DMT)-like permease
MTPFAFLTLLTSSLAWSGLDLVRKLLAAKLDPVVLVWALGFGQGLLLAIYCVATGVPLVTTAYWLPAGGSIALNIVGNWLFVEALAIAPYSLVLPMLALVPVFSVVMSVPMLHELPQPRQIAGIMLIVAGALWLNWPADGAGWRAFAQGRGSLMGLGVAVIWSLAGPCDKLGTLASNPAFHGAFVNLGMSVGFLLILTLRGRLAKLKELRHHLGLLVAGCVVGSVAIMLQFVAMRLMLVSLMEAVKRMIGLAMAVILGRAAFGEAITGRKLGAIAAMAGGLALALL